MWLRRKSAAHGPALPVPRLPGFVRLGHSRHVCQIRIRLGETHKLVVEGRPCRRAIRVDECDPMRKVPAHGIAHDAAKRSDPDSAGDEHHREGGIRMEPESPSGAGKVHRCPERHLGETPLECRAGHAGGDHEAPGVLGRGGNGKYPAVALRVGMRGIGQNHDHELASLEFKPGRSFQRECHGAFGHLGSLDQRCHQSRHGCLRWRRCRMKPLAFRIPATPPNIPEIALALHWGFCRLESVPIRDGQRCPVDVACGAERGRADFTPVLPTPGPATHAALRTGRRLTGYLVTSNVECLSLRRGMDSEAVLKGEQSSPSR